MKASKMIKINNQKPVYAFKFVCVCDKNVNFFWELLSESGPQYRRCDPGLPLDEIIVTVGEPL